MRAILLAAGKGERLGDITKSIPKPMLKINDEVILEHNMKWLKKYGIKEFYVNLHYLPKVIKGYFKSNRVPGVKVRYSYERVILGTAGAIKKIASNWKAPFLVIYADNFYPLGYNLNKFIDFYFRKKISFLIALYKNKREIYKSGVVLLKENHLIDEFIEKPLRHDKIQKKQFSDNCFINTGIYLLDPSVVDYIAPGYSDFGKDIFPKLIDGSIPVYGYIFQNKLIPIDTIELYREYTRKDVE